MKKDNKLETITPSILIVGVDIAKTVQWARFTDYRGLELGKPIKFKNNKTGFESIVASIEGVCKLKNLDKVIVGMEPTGHYWKPLANYLKHYGIEVVMINPYHTKRVKELDDNSPNMPQDIFAELRVLSNSRISLMRRHNALKNTIKAILDEYFPELGSVFKYPLKSKASMQILKSYPFPSMILELGVDGVLAEIKKSVKKTVGIKKAQELVKAAQNSVGVDYGLISSKLKLEQLIEELELLTTQLKQIEDAMEKALNETGYKEVILGIPGIGIVTAASLLGEIGDPLRFDHPRQIHKMAGYNLVEDSSGKSKSGTVISKRGRKNLRSILYQIARTMVSNNAELKELYKYLKTRPNNPLKGKQALVVISKKVVTIIYYLAKKQTEYKAELVFNEFRKNQMKQVQAA